MSQTQRILVVLPNWVGDAVMATPALRAVRELYPGSHISFLLRRYVKRVCTGMPFCDRMLTYRTGKGVGRIGRGVIDLAARLRAGRFDMALLLTNSFKSALLCRLAGIQQIIGYERDGRSFLLTDRLLPHKERGRYVPTPMIGYYLGIPQYLGWRGRDRRLELFVTAPERQQAMQVLLRAGVDVEADRPGARGGNPLVMLNPGAAYGPAKCWAPENFAAVADRLIEEHGATILLCGSPKERALVEAVQRRMRHASVDLSSKGLNLGSLKEIVRRCDLVLTNDTGVRHIAAAFGTPVVTIFGPTDPQWTEINFERERQISAKVFCAPCQKKICPLDHRCMARIAPAMVCDKAIELLNLARNQAAGNGSAGAAQSQE